MSQINPIPTHWRFQNLVGHRFGRLVVLSYVGRQRSTFRWICRCDCGTEKSCLASGLRNGSITSCGCRLKEVAASKFRIHGLTGTPTHRIWRGMHDRCNSPLKTCYQGRGITVCERWKDFELFLSDMGEVPSPKHSIDRIDNNGNYEPGNCRWATHMQQCRNKRTSRLETFNGETLTLSEWAQRFSISQSKLRGRLNLGWTFAAAIQQ
jgi:hypothetical protein